MIRLTPQSEGRPERDDTAASAELSDRQTRYNRREQARLNLAVPMARPEDRVQESHASGLPAQQNLSGLEQDVSKLYASLQAGKLSREQLKAENARDAALVKGHRVFGSSQAAQMEQLRKRMLVRSAVLQKADATSLAVQTKAAVPVNVITEANAEATNEAYTRRRKRARCKTARMREYNTCHDPKSGQFCSKGGGAPDARGFAAGKPNMENPAKRLPRDERGAYFEVYKGVKIRALPSYSTPYYYADHPGPKLGSFNHSRIYSRIKRAIDMYGPKVKKPRTDFDPRPFPRHHTGRFL